MCQRENFEDNVPCVKGEKQDEYQEVSNNLRNPLMIVEMIANKLDCKCVAESLNCKFEGGEPSSCICYMENIKEYYDFDHIIIIGKIYVEIIFLNCYSHVFIWESMNYALLLLRDYCNKATKNNRPV
ncbi:15686_t:CDS:1 [Funneliformis caledonium]|uniref:15686_t:CDS:1 n=1 Tax=Funneliformis caledonium TaxID=1117310 RepID=A0A9N8YUD8_9GLOM|nr:15686_t:CDS:1 [Funneliformis caledonium]